MNCRRVNLLLGVYGQLDRAERRMVDAHLRDCQHCRQAWHDEIRTRALIGRIADSEPSAGFEARLRSIATTPPPAAAAIGRLTTRFSVLLAIAIGGSLLAGLVPWAPPIPGRSATGGGQVASTPAAASQGGRGGSGSPVSGAAPREAAAGVIERRGKAELAFAVPEPGELARPEPADPPANDRRQAIGAFAAWSPAERSGSRPPEPPEALPVVLPDAPADPVRRDDGSAPSSPPAGPTTRASQQPVATVTASPTTRACSAITAQVFVDIDGLGSLVDCPGCDGAWTADDAERAALVGATLPAGLQLFAFDARGDVVFEETIGDPRSQVPLPPMVNVSLGDLPCDALPLTIKLTHLPASWAACPSTGTLEHTVSATGPWQLAFALIRACPVAVPTATATPTATLPASPTARPTALPAGIGDLTPTPQPTDLAPMATPTPIVPEATPVHLTPSATWPPEAASPTAPPSLEPTALAPIRWRPTASPTPTARPTRDRPDPSVPKTLEPPGAPPWPTPTPGGEPKPRVDRRP